MLRHFGTFFLNCGSDVMPACAKRSTRSIERCHGGNRTSGNRVDGRFDQGESGGSRAAYRLEWIF